MEFIISVNSHAVCYVISIASILSGISIDLYATCIFHHTVYIMYCSHKLRRITPEQSKRYFTYYIIYHLSTIMIVFLGMVGYDMVKDNYNSIILPNGHCIYTNRHQDDTCQIPIVIAGINKMAQLTLFIAYLCYIYQLNKDISNPVILERQQSLLHKIALAMGAVVGLSYMVYAVNVITRLDTVPYVALIASLFLVQQSVIIAIFLCSKKMRRKYRGCLAKEQTGQ